VEAAADAAARAEMHRFLVQQVLALPEPQRALVLLHYFEGEEVAVLARQCGLTANAVRAHLRRARDTLRLRLQQGDGTVRHGYALVLAVGRYGAIADSDVVQFPGAEIGAGCWDRAWIAPDPEPYKSTSVLNPP
jgi:hypothetical protein